MRTNRRAVEEPTTPWLEHTSKGEYAGRRAKVGKVSKVTVTPHFWLGTSSLIRSCDRDGATTSATNAPIKPLPFGELGYGNVICLLWNNNMVDLHQLTRREYPESKLEAGKRSLLGVSKRSLAYAEGA